MSDPSDRLPPDHPVLTALQAERRTVRRLRAELRQERAERQALEGFGIIRSAVLDARDAIDEILDTIDSTNNR